MYRLMEKRVELNLLLDFYGALLTEHRREILRLYVEEDMTLQEIAEEMGISRQGVHDSINKARAQLEEYEGKLGLLDRFRRLKAEVARCSEELQTARAALERAERIIKEIR